MGFIERELERISAALHQQQSDQDYCNLYAAQQALSWALEPTGYAAPFDVVVNGKVQPLLPALAERTT